GLELILCDTKNKTADHSNRIYVPYDDTRALDYYNDIAKRRKDLKLEVVRLPKKITPQYVKSIDNYPGILALALREEDNIDEHYDKKKSPKTVIRGVPFVVPGGRFNEMYGWDSYFETLGLLVDERPLLGKSMVDNFVYEIEHYGKILNANRSYYLTRSQPPFLTDMINRIYYNGYVKTSPKPLTKESISQWQYISFTAAIKELLSVWLNDPRIERQSGLSCYHTEGFGIPPETEATHFVAILTEFGKKYNMDWESFKKAYMNEEIKDPEVDEYFVHDRAVRESGHDTSYRLEKKCANLACVDLNSLIFKYEIDIADYIHKFCNDDLKSDLFYFLARLRKNAMNKYCWNDEKKIFYDWDWKQQSQNEYDSPTSMWPLWCGCAEDVINPSSSQAEDLIKTSLKLFEVSGGIVGCTEESRGPTSLVRPNRQWDYPYGWAPHQIMTWQALKNYGHSQDSGRLAYRWLYTVLNSFVHYNGVVPEKFNVVSIDHKCKVEYGNVGIDFKCLSKEGFGWMNASFEVGITYLSREQRMALGALIHPDQYFNRKKN
ncbi:glycoside hydrolase family 37 protein, partial [Piromyces sp. E2]